MVTYVYNIVNQAPLYSTTTSGANSYTIPSGVSLIYVMLGGGGASIDNLQNGGFTTSLIPVTAGEVLTINIGASGASSTLTFNGVQQLGAGYISGSSNGFCYIWQVS